MGHSMAFSQLVTVVVLIYNTGVLGAEVRSSIVGGHEAETGKWPWMAFLSLTPDGVKKWFCDGTILNSEWVLTAANCLDRQPPPIWSRSMVWVGSHSLEKSSPKYRKISSHVLHSKYKAVGQGYINDIALVKILKIPLSKAVAPVSLASIDDTFTSSSECFIIGWGNIGKDVPLPSPKALQQLKIPLISETACKEKYPTLRSDMLCAGDIAGGKDACSGDYGGPLVCRSGKDFVQVGIMSYGSCGLPDQPGIYTKVSKYLGFINTYIHKSEEASAEV